MCNANCIIFGILNLKKDEVIGKRIVEVGSNNINGSLRPIIELLLEPAKYIGVDIESGVGVDVICDAEELLTIFEKESFDIVISTELLEHVRNWRKVISNLKNICKPNGILLITTRSCGFRYHGYPYDFWRYEIEDMEAIFADFLIERLEKDGYEPGVFLKARKPSDFIEKNLSEYLLFSVIAEDRIRDIDDNILKKFVKRYYRKRFFKNIERKTRIFFKEMFKRP